MEFKRPRLETVADLATRLCFLFGYTSAFRSSFLSSLSHLGDINVVISISWVLEMLWASQAAEFVARVLPTLEGADAPLQCVQRSGDLLYVPARWGHSALNLRPTVGVAIGFRTQDVASPSLVVKGQRSCASSRTQKQKDEL